MTVPIIDGIDHKTFEYRPVYGENQHFRGIFEVNAFFYYFYVFNLNCIPFLVGNVI